MKKLILSILFLLCLNINANADQWKDNNLAGLYYVSDRDPTATEDGMQQIFIDNGLTITNYSTQFYWFNTSTNGIFDYVEGANGSLQWVERGYTPQARMFNRIVPILNSPTQISATRDCQAFYYVDIQISTLLLGSASGSVYLEYADDSSFTNNVISLGPVTHSVSGIVSDIDKKTAILSGIIPGGKYYRIRTVINSGTVTFTPQPSQQVLL